MFGSERILERFWDFWVMVSGRLDVRWRMTRPIRPRVFDKSASVGCVRVSYNCRCGRLALAQDLK